jgi:hypothetical protein
MPQIPLYNKGLGSTGLTTGGSLGPRASAGAFTGVGQEVAKFGEAAGNIMFDFYDADKKAAAKTAIADAENELELVKKISSEYKLRPNEQETLVARLSDLSAGKQQQGRSQAYGKQEYIRGQVVSDTLTRYESTMASHPEGHPEYIKAAADAYKLIDQSNRDGTIKHSSIKTNEQFRISVQKNTFVNRVQGATGYADLKKAKEDINKSTQSLTIKNALLKLTIAKENEINRQEVDSATNQLDESDATFGEIAVIREKLRKNENVSLSLESGKTISINGKNLSQAASNSIQSFLTSREKEVEDVALNDGTDQIIHETEENGLNAGLETAKTFVKNMKNKEKAEGSVLSSALNLQNKARRLLDQYKENPSEEDINKIKELTKASKELLETRYDGRPALVNQESSNGTSANNSLNALNTIEIDLEKEIKAAGIVTSASDSLRNGNFTLIKSSLTKKQTDAAIKIALKGKDVDTQMLILERNNVKSEDYANILGEGSTNILGVQPDVNKVKSQIELFRIMKSRGNGVLQNHLNKEEIAIYNSVLTLEQSGKSLEESIATVNEAYATNINIEPKYKTVQSQVSEISSQTTSWFGDKPKNSSSVQQKVENLSKLYIRLGTDPKLAVQKAGKDIIASHINHKGVLIPRSINMNETDIRKNADLIIEDYKANNPDDDSDITATPITGRVDKWMVIRDGFPFPNETYTLDELTDLSKIKESKRKQEIIDKQNKEQERKEKTPAAIEEEKRLEQMRKETKDQLGKLFKTDFKLKRDQTPAAIKEEERLEKMRKETKESFKQNVLGPKLR